MKKKLFTLLLALVAIATTAQAQVVLNETNFPDANFRAALASILGISEGDEITEAKIAATTMLSVNSWSIADLTGIEHFTALERLYCYNNQLTTLDVSKNTVLTLLRCYNNQLTALDVSQNTALTELYCSDNQLTSLDVSKNTSLTTLHCQHNPLTSLDASGCTSLSSLDCTEIGLTSLNVSGCTALTRLKCYYNQLTSLNVSGCTALTYLECFKNQLTSLDVSGCTALEILQCHYNQLTSLNVSGCTALISLWCQNNQIKGKEMDALVASLLTTENSSFCVIDTKDENEGNVCTKLQVAVAKEKGWKVYDYNGGPAQEYEGSDDATAKLLLNAENFPDANFRAALAEILQISEGAEITAEKIAATTRLEVSERSISDLTGIEHFAQLKELYCYANRLTALDVSQNTAMEMLSCGSNQFTSLDVSKNTTLTSLSCGSNQLTSLDISQNTALEYLWCSSNQLTSLDVSQNTALTRLHCDNNQLTSLDMSKNTALKELGCYHNQLTSLDVSINTALTELNCSSNLLTSLDVSMNTALIGLWCYGNQLTSLDVSKNNALWSLYCYNNQLTSLDVSKNTALSALYCNYNQLTSLDVSMNTALTGLWCYGNQLTSLDVLGCTALKQLYCHRNQLTSLDVSRCTALTDLMCYYNQLTSLDVSGCTALEYLDCFSNQLTSLDVSKNTALTGLSCFSNQIKGKEMDFLVAGLPTVENGEFYVIDTKDEKEGNVCTKSQVAVAPKKGWKVYDYNGGNYPYPEYEGSDPVEEDIDPVDEGDNVDFGNDMDENSDLDGNVIGNIYYNVGNGNGEYDAANGCVVITKPTDDGTMNDLEGKDIFGEDFKGQFTGIAFKVPTGKGTVKVTAETTGNMLLKVKIGNNDPVDMELEGKLKISFPYNVTEETFVYIYAGVSNEAKGFGKASSTDAALKIYGIEFLRDDTTAIDASLNDNGQRTNDSWYTIDGKKLNGEPTKKGVYIHKGKKVKK